MNLIISVAGFVLCMLGLAQAWAGWVFATQLSIFLESAFSSFLMLLLSGFLLYSSGEKDWKKTRLFYCSVALWVIYMILLVYTVYLLLPMACMLIQMRFYGLYVIVFGTSVAAFFMFMYILMDQTERF